MKIALYNQQGENIGEATLPKEIFEVKLNQDLIWQVVVSQIGNRRMVIAKAKNRGEVSGGGKKPWRQKGTGKARAGSTRSPLWRHGGTTFGPVSERVFKRNIPSKMKRTALFMALSDKAKNNSLLILDDLNIDKPKTKLLFEILNKLPSRDQSTLLVLPKMDEKLITACHNLTNTHSIQAKDLNCLEIVSSKYVIMPKDSIKVIKETFLEKSKIADSKPQVDSKEEKSAKVSKL